jgi:hypothetical protein
MPLSPEQKQQLDQQAFTEVMQEQQAKPGWLQSVDEAVLPTGGNIIGGAFGGGVGAPFGMAIPGAIAGESIGGALGEGANQLLGITQPSLTNIGMAAVAPPAIRGAIGAAKAGIARIPGAAVELQALGTKMAKQMAGKSIEPSGTSQELFTMLKQMSDDGAKQGMGPILIPQKHLLQTSKDILEREMRVPIESSRDSSVLKLAEEAKHLAETNPDGIPIEAFQSLKSRFGRDSAFDTTKPKSSQAANKQLFASLERDLDEAVKGGGTPAADMLKAATQASKLEMTRDELADHIARKIVQPQQNTGLEYVNAKGLMQHLKNDKRIRGLPLDQQDDLKATASMLLKIPNLPPPGQFGSGRAVGRAGLVGAGTLYATGDPTMSSIAGGIAAGAPQVISYALTTTPGRALMRALLESNQGTLTHKALSILSSFMTATQSQPGTRMTQ